MPNQTSEAGTTEVGEGKDPPEADGEWLVVQHGHRRSGIPQKGNLGN